MVRPTLRLLACLTLLATAASGQTCPGWVDPVGPFVGLVHVPAIHSPRDGGEGWQALPASCRITIPGEVGFRKPVWIRARPHPRAPKMVTWTGPALADWQGRERILDSLEYRYEVRAAVALRKQGQWYELRVSDSGQTGWLHRSQACDYQDLGRFLGEHGSQLTEAWDRRLYRSPDPLAGSRSYPETASDGTVEVLRTRRVAGELWAKVRLMDESLCTRESGDPREVGRGWLPVFSFNGCLALWFHSRGC